MFKPSNSNLFTILFAVLTAILAIGLIACYWNRGWLSIGSASDLAQIFESIAVGLSLLFIATQLRQQTKLAKSSNSQSFVNACSNFVLAIGGNPALMKLYSTGGDGFERLSPEEKVQYRYLVSWWLTFYENVVYQHGCRLLDEGVYDSWMRDMDGFIRRRRVEKIWFDLRNNYSHEFIESFESRLPKRNHELEPLASSTGTVSQ